MMEIIEINENTWSIEDGFVRFFLLVGTEMAIMIDSGMNCADARETAEQLTNLPIMLLNTHGDGDHVSGTGAWSEIYMTEEDYNDCGVGKRFPNTKLCKVNDGDIFDLGNRKLEIITIPGHTAGSVAILDIQNRILIAGDSVQNGDIYMFGDKRRPDEYSVSLQKLIGMANRYDNIFASHGELVLPADHVSKVLESWNRVRAGQIEGNDVDMFGQKVILYKTENCGFFCQ